MYLRLQNFTSEGYLLTFTFPLLVDPKVGILVEF